MITACRANAAAAVAAAVTDLGSEPGHQRGQSSAVSLCVVRVVISALRCHWSAVPLALAAVVLLALGATLSAPASTAMVGAGSALAGAAATRIIDLDRERRAEEAQAAKSRLIDLDETRRVAYMALASLETERYELAATIVNALAHRGSAVDPDIAMRHVIAIVNREPGDTGESEAWLRARIKQIITELNPT